MPRTYECTDDPSDIDLTVVDAGLDHFNGSEPELRNVRPLCVFVRDASGQIRGGAVGRTWGQCCELQQLWVAEKVRGHGVGAELMIRFEEQALQRGCSLIYLDTFSFQARPFYERLRYGIVLETTGFSSGIVKYTMHKKLEPAETEA